MSIELMLNGVNLSFVAFAAHGTPERTDFCVLRDGGSGRGSRGGDWPSSSLSIRTRETLNVDQVNLLKL